MTYSLGCLIPISRYLDMCMLPFGSVPDLLVNSNSVSFCVIKLRACLSLVSQPWSSKMDKEATKTEFWVWPVLCRDQDRPIHELGAYASLSFETEYVLTLIARGDEGKG